MQLSVNMVIHGKDAGKELTPHFYKAKKVTHESASILITTFHG